MTDGQQMSFFFVFRLFLIPNRSRYFGVLTNLVASRVFFFPSLFSVSSPALLFTLSIGQIGPSLRSFIHADFPRGIPMHTLRARCRNKKIIKTKKKRSFFFPSFHSTGPQTDRPLRGCGTVAQPRRAVGAGSTFCRFLVPPVQLWAPPPLRFSSRSGGSGQGFTGNVN